MLLLHREEFDGGKDLNPRADEYVKKAGRITKSPKPNTGHLIPGFAYVSDCKSIFNCYSFLPPP